MDDKGPAGILTRASILFHTGDRPGQGTGVPAHGKAAAKRSNRCHRNPDHDSHVSPAAWKGTITSLRIGFDNPGPAKLVIKSFHTACDTRHNINNSNFIRGCHDYFIWSLNYTFLRDQIGRVRSAMRFMMREFDTRNRKCVYTAWPGHEGRSGVRYVDGKKVVIAGEGIGSNYWDLLPFGGEDALATIYYYDALLDLANLEEQIAAHPAWNVAAGPTRLTRRTCAACTRGEDVRHQAILEREDRPFRHRRPRRSNARLRLDVPQQRSHLLRFRHTGTSQIHS